MKKSNLAVVAATAVIGANRILGYAVFSKVLARNFIIRQIDKKAYRYRGYEKCLSVPTFNGETDRPNAYALLTFGLNHIDSTESEGCLAS